HSPHRPLCATCPSPLSLHVALPIWPTASVTSYTINGNGGSDTLTVNYGASGGFFTFPVTFHGGVGDFDRLIVTGGTFTNVTHTLDRKSTRLHSSHQLNSYALFFLHK